MIELRPDGETVVVRPNPNAVVQRPDERDEDERDGN